MKNLIKQFLKPDWKKILMLILISALINIPSIGYHKGICYTNIEEFPEYECTKARLYLMPTLHNVRDFHNPMISILDYIQENLKNGGRICGGIWSFSCIFTISFSTINFLFIVFYWYFLSCSIVLAYDKFRKAKQ